MASIILPAVVGSLAQGAGWSFFATSIAQAAAGFVGGYIDRSLGFLPTPGQVEGPRLEDLSVQLASEGSPMHRVWGTARVAGTLIWSSGLEEIKTETDEGGGGSGGGAGGTIQYHYRTDVAVGICEGETDCLVRIWADTKLIYNVLESATEEEQEASAALNFRFYKGTPDQTPDPLIQAIEGEDKTPAFRNTCYIVFEDFPLENYGNRIPNFTFEIISVPTEVVVDGPPAGVAELSRYLTTGVVPPWKFLKTVPYVDIDNYVGARIKTNFDGFNAGTGTAITEAITPYSYHTSYQTAIGAFMVFRGDDPDTSPLGWNRPQEYDWYEGAHNFYAWSYSNYPYDATNVGGQDEAPFVNESWTSPVTEPEVYSLATWHNSWGTNEQSTDPVVKWLGGGSYCNAGFVRLFAQWNTFFPGYTGVYHWYNIARAYTLRVTSDWYFANPGYTVVCGNPFDDEEVVVANIGNAPIIVTVRRDYGVLKPPKGSGITINEVFGYFRYLSREYIDTTTWPSNYMNGKQVYKINRNGYNNGNPLTPILEEGDDDDNQTFWENAYNAVAPYMTSAEKIGRWGTATPSYSIKSHSNQGASGHYPMLTDRAFEIIRYVSLGIEGSVESLLEYTENNPIEGSGSVSCAVQQSIPLSRIVRGICLLSGLEPNYVNASELAEIPVRGFAYDPTTGRSLIEHLMMLFNFDMVDTGAEYKAVLRGGDIVRTLTVNDFALKSKKLQLKRMTENPRELPSSILMRFPNVEANYQTGAQLYRKPNAYHFATHDVSTAVVFNNEEAFDIAYRLLNNIWKSSVRYEGVVSSDHFDLIATDPVQIDAFSTAERVRITSTEIDDTTTISITGEVESAVTYTPPVPRRVLGVDIDNIIATPPPAPLVGSYALLVDIPLLRDIDSIWGMYGIIYGADISWTGGALYRSIDQGASWNKIGQQTKGDIRAFGSTLSTLPAPNHVHTWDTKNTLTVRLRFGQLQNAPSVMSVLNGANAALVGSGAIWEVIQYRYATLNSDGSYTLSGLLRGLRGTEHNAGKVMANAYFISADTATLKEIPVATTYLYQQARYKPVTIGSPIESAGYFPAYFMGIRARPYSPCHVRAVKEVNGDITITWIRRDRIGNQWLDNSDIGMSETVEQYRIFIKTTGNIVKRTITGHTTTSYTYTAADQTTDFGGPATAFNLDVQQYSSVVGYGLAASKTFSL